MNPMSAFSSRPISAATRLQRQGNVELVAAGTGQIVERQDLVLPVDQLVRQQVAVRVRCG